MGFGRSQRALRENRGGLDSAGWDGMPIMWSPPVGEEIYSGDFFIESSLPGFGMQIPGEGSPFGSLTPANVVGVQAIQLTMNDGVSLFQLSGGVEISGFNFNPLQMNFEGFSGDPDPVIYTYNQTTGFYELTVEELGDLDNYFIANNNQTVELIMLKNALVPIYNGSMTVGSSGGDTGYRVGGPAYGIMNPAIINTATIFEITTFGLNNGAGVMDMVGNIQIPGGAGRNLLIKFGTDILREWDWNPGNGDYTPTVLDVAWENYMESEDGNQIPVLIYFNGPDPV